MRDYSLDNFLPRRQKLLLGSKDMGVVDHGTLPVCRTLQTILPLRYRKGYYNFQIRQPFLKE
jgi:hypothetical protein